MDNADQRELRSWRQQLGYRALEGHVVVNAVGESKFWDSTAIFIFWDDPGRWYDPEAPAYVDNDGLGYRLPLLIISPYAKQGFVSHTHYEHGSILGSSRIGSVCRD